jgi:hypothetical protein
MSMTLINNPSSPNNSSTQTASAAQGGQGKGNTVCPNPQPPGKCPAGTIVCNNDCINPNTDKNNCGGCSAPGCNPQGVQCASNEACVDKKCVIACPSGQCRDSATTCKATTTDGTVTSCNGACINTKTDEANCGACGNVCSGNQACFNGACKPACPSGQCFNSATNTCVSPSQSGTCGTCVTQEDGSSTFSGTSCTGGQTCQTTDTAGTFACACPSGTCLQNGQCVSPDQTATCGTCNGGTFSGTSCTGGQTCQPTNQPDTNACACPPGQCTDAVSQSCVSPTSTNTCGTCNGQTFVPSPTGQQCGTGQTCPSGQCIQTSCTSGATLCGSGATAYCAFTSSDPQNCGTCGKQCNPATEVCSNGQCVTQVSCGPNTCQSGNACVVEGGSNCGSGTTCTTCQGTTPVCNTSTHQCVQCTSDAQCSGTTPHCDTTTNTCVQCTDKSQCPTPAHGTATCTANKCGVACTAPYVPDQTGTKCVCPSNMCTDAAGNCQAGTTTGACGPGGGTCVACQSGQACTNGACTLSCASGQCVSNGACVTSSNTNCGTGGGTQACVNCAAVGKVCNNGVCSGCTTDTQCASGQFCNNPGSGGVCIPKVTCTQQGSCTQQGRITCPNSNPPGQCIPKGQCTACA